MNLPSRRIVEDQSVYEVVFLADPTVRFHVTADTDTNAKVEALDKIGYHVLPLGNGEWAIVDADDHDDVMSLVSEQSFDTALDAALKRIQWRLLEPTEMIGGALGTGFGEANE